jgi:hypothetical protein
LSGLGERLAPMDNDPFARREQRRDAMRRLNLLTGLLVKGLHPLSVDLVEPYPIGLWTGPDGREVLFDQERRPIWQRQPGGVFEPADADQLLNDIDDSEFLFSPYQPIWQQYEGMKTLRSILIAWGGRSPSMTMRKRKPGQKQPHREGIK